MNDGLDSFSIKELKDELKEGLRIYAETAWGWSELKAGAFIRQVEKRKGVVIAYSEIRSNGALTIRIPRRV